MGESLRDPNAEEHESSRITGQIAVLYKTKCRDGITLFRIGVSQGKKNVEMEEEILKLKTEKIFCQMQDHLDKHMTHLGQLKDSLVLENRQF